MTKGWLPRGLICAGPDPSTHQRVAATPRMAACCRLRRAGCCPSPRAARLACLPACLQICEVEKLPSCEVDMVLEGGSIHTDGEG
jgi:hypothetical protein